MQTFHLEGSATSDKDIVKISSLIDKFVIIEEKIDGTNIGISFDNNADITIHTSAKITNPKEFTRLYAWTKENINKLWDLINDRYILHGMWTYAKHTIFYNNLCGYFLECDIYDRKTEKWLSTYKRQELISLYGGDIICSVPILKIGRIHFGDTLNQCIMPSFYKTDKWKQDLEFYCDKFHYDYSKIIQETDDSLLSAGLYIKHEDKDSVIGKYKYIRSQFAETMLNSKPNNIIIPNVLTKEMQ